MRRAFLLMAPVLLGVVATLLSGLAENPLVFDREPTNYFHFYGVPSAWYSVPTDQCAALNRQFHAYASCDGGFIQFGLIVDITFYTLLSIPFVYLTIRTFRKSKAPS